MSPIHLTQENFKKEILDYKGVALVDFWAPWCMPCQMIGGMIDEIANELKDVKVGKINVDEENNLAQEFQIMSIPAIYIFKNGNIVEKLIGAQNKEIYKETLEKYID